MVNAEQFYKDWDRYCLLKAANALISEDDYKEGLAECEWQQAEIDAENAWLRKAEEPTLDDMGFEAYECNRLMAGDSNYGK